MRRPRADPAPARARPPVAPPPVSAGAAPAGPDGPAGAGPRRPRRPRGRGAARRAAPDGASRATRAARAGSWCEQPLDDGGRLRAGLAELGGVARARGCEMRPPTTLSTRPRGDRVGDVPRLHPLLHQIVGDAHMHAGALAVREQDGDRALVARAERIHHEPDLIAILEIGVRDVELDVADALHVSRFPVPASGLDQLVHALLELLVLFQQLLDAAHQVLRLRLERAGRILQLPLEPADQ